MVPVTTGWALSGIWSAVVTLPSKTQAACVILGLDSWSPLAGLENKCWGNLVSACWVTEVTDTLQRGSMGSWVGEGPTVTWLGTRALPALRADHLQE